MSFRVQEPWQLLVEFDASFSEYFIANSQPQGHSLENQAILSEPCQPPLHVQDVMITTVPLSSHPDPAVSVGLEWCQDLVAGDGSVAADHSASGDGCLVTPWNTGHLQLDRSFYQDHATSWTSKQVPPCEKTTRKEPHQPIVQPVRNRKRNASGAVVKSPQAMPVADAVDLTTVPQPPTNAHPSREIIGVNEAQPQQCTGKRLRSPAQVDRYQQHVMELIELDGAYAEWKRNACLQVLQGSPIVLE